jgi:hypothetical protein
MVFKGEESEGWMKKESYGRKRLRAGKGNYTARFYPAPNGN